jgi:glycerol-3-phosphate dehydrogenase
MNRHENLKKLQNQTFDICIIGAGASGAGCALDATLRGFNVALIDRNDFASETSSKSTKLIHGGVRYLEQAFKNFDFAQLKQVKHGLEERHTVLRNAPHLAHPLAIVTPVFSWFEGLYFTIGLKIYGLFAQNDTLPQAQWLNRKETFERIPTLTQKLHSSVMYYDGQLDDARYCLALAHTANESGAVVANYTELLGFEKNKETISKALVKDRLTGEEYGISAKLFINCTGHYADFVRQMANPKLDSRIRPSKGVHLVLPSEVLKSDSAMLIPKTKDGRLVFVIPFEGSVNVGTTDDEYHSLTEEPLLEAQEVNFLMETLEPFLEKKPSLSQIKAGFGGIRPLIAAPDSTATKKLLRDHEVEHDKRSNLLSLLGGKWTTYRLMAQDTIDKAAQILGKEVDCSSAEKYLVGGENFDPNGWRILREKYAIDEYIARHLNQKYGSRADNVAQLTLENSDWKNRLISECPFIEAEVVYQVREEMACTPRDVLARRWRLEISDWSACQAVLPKVCQLMATQLGWDDTQRQAQMNQYYDLLKKFSSMAAC